MCGYGRAAKRPRAPVLYQLSEPVNFPMRAEIYRLFSFSLILHEAEMNVQLPIFSLRFLAIALPLMDGAPTFHVFECIDMYGETIGYAFLEVEEPHAAQ